MPLNTMRAGLAAKAYGFTAALQQLGASFAASYTGNTSTPNDIGYGIVANSTGSVYVAGRSTPDNGTNWYFGLLSIVQAGTSLNFQKYLGDDATNKNAIPYGVCKDSSDNFIPFGYAWNTSNGQNGLLAKYNSSGTLQWQRGLADAKAAAQQNTANTGGCADASGNIFVVGNYPPTAGGQVGHLTKYNSSGTMQWSKYYQDARAAGTWEDNLYAVTTDASGNIYTTGYYRNSSGGNNVCLTKHDSTGAITWQISLADANAAASQIDYGYGVVLDSAGNVYVAGSTKNTSNRNMCFLAKYNSSGTLQWQRQLIDANSATLINTYATSLVIDGSDNLYVSGRCNNTSAGAEGFVAKYNSSGTIQWQRQIYESTYAAASRSTILRASALNGNYILVTGNDHGYMLMVEMPTDGSKTGTFNLPNGKQITIATGSLTDSAGVMTSSTPSNTVGTSALTSTTPTGATTTPTGSYSGTAI